MPRYVAFLRAINVGGRTVRMELLRRLFEAQGFSDVETFIASGNVLFRAGAKNARSLEEKIERMLAESLGFEVATFVRTDAELTAVAAYKPFGQDDLDSAAALNVGFLAEELAETDRRVLDSFTTEVDKFHTRGREVYWLCRRKQSGSTFSNAVFERALRRTSTWRTWNTVSRIAAKFTPPAL